ncbi:MAG: GNAT family N-acetyltransferase [Bacteroidia bacterium]
MIEVQEIKTESQLQDAFDIRRQVFVVEQAVDPAEEYDEFEGSCLHFIASFKGIASGTCRIRKTENGTKLERFAVLEKMRGKGIGKALVEACLNQLRQQTHTGKIYLHAQEHALGFYAQMGFQAEGERFWEAGIPHFNMHLVSLP